MFEVQILIPVADNSGHAFTASHHVAFESFAANLFGGITRLPRLTIGVWVEALVVYNDRCRVYVVAIGSIVDGGKVGQLAQFAKVHYQQKAIYVRYLTLSEVI